MERSLKRSVCLSLWLAFIQILIHLGNNTLLFPRKLTSNDPHPDFISIDCGANNDYLDPGTDIWYQTDRNFIDTGTNCMISAQSMVDVNYDYFGGQLKTLRSFPKGERNCYTLKPKQGKNNNYLIRAFFSYGNYDGKNQTPSFDLYLGVNYWETVDPPEYYHFTEIIHSPTSDTIHVCLVKGLTGVPFISALELRPLSNFVYQTPSPSESLLVLQARSDVGSTNPSSHSRCKDDIYDRLWYNGYEIQHSQRFNTTADIDAANTNNSYYKLPPEVLKSAARSFNVSYTLIFDFNSIWQDLDESFKFYVYFHFMEIEELGRGHKRIINITLNDENIMPQPLVLEYMKPTTISHQINQNDVLFNISATSESDAPPILNAYEIYKLISPLSSPTDKTDVDAILDIKETYKINKLDWQGDPCLVNLPWEGLRCSFKDNKERIISVNLSASKLKGDIATSFSLLTELDSLDLSFNELSGPVPEFLAELPKLRILNLTGNKLSGSIPKALKENSDLQWSLDDNPGLCPRDPCKTHKFVIPLVACISAFVVTLLVSLGAWILITKKLKVVITVSTKEDSLELKNRSISHSKVLKITNNFQNMIGEGGFGKVYFGTLNNDTPVAVKLLSQSSLQGFREFQSEVKLLMVVHHRHLVSLIGYCEEGGVRALIYEYMANGNLQQHLSDENPNVLKWNERLQIALEAALGLDYLHNGCKPPIVHRDLKTSNILLNENMQAKISDFGLSRAFANEIDTHVSTRPAGTLGYLDPEFQTSGNLNKRSDVYSFGIILLELITGQPAIRRENGIISHILHSVTPKLEMGDIQSIVDPRLQGAYSANTAWKLLDIAMSCIPPSAVQRPDISHVVVELKECVSLEITMAKSKSRRRNLSTSLDMDSLRFDSGFIPSAR